MTKPPIYLDNNATTRTDPRVVEAMLPYFTERYGNPASTSHSLGWEAAEAVAEARAHVAAMIGADSKEIVFTSGATESDNLALHGVCDAYRDKGRHVITVASEHKAILDPAHQLESDGARVTYLPVDRYGLFSLEAIEEAITPETVLVSVMMANNEIGTLYDIESIGALCRRRGVLFHTDATQAIGKMPIDVEKLNIDLMSFTAHKMHGPKGVGALYVRRRNPRVALVQQIAGGGHEGGGRRSGTLDTPGIVGFGKIAQLCQAELSENIAHSRMLRDRLQAGLLRIDDAQVNGHPESRLPNTLSIQFPGAEALAVMPAIPDIAMAAGAACASGSISISHVLKAIGLTDMEAMCTLRLSIARFNTEAEVEYVIDRITNAVAQIRADIKAANI